MIDDMPKEKCVGCKACGDVCPKGAIQYALDSEGFWYPQIDASACIGCNLCEKVCPVSASCRYKSGNTAEPEVYAAYHKNPDIRYNSTSGGVYYALAQAVLSRKGCLVGCAYSSHYESAIHMVADDQKGLSRLMRSKYFQSDTQGIYQQTKVLLEKGSSVLFSGAPCQVGALYSFLGKEYSNLYTCDFICRGINSPAAYRQYMKELEKRYHSRIAEVHFKNKTQGWSNLGTFVRFENGKTYFRNRNTDPWVNAFIVGNLYMRPACSNCQFKKIPRVSDISFGDFWGLEVSKKDNFYGVSAVLVNNKKGEELLNQAKRDLYLEKHLLKEAVDGNPALLNSIPMGAKREEFFNRIQTEPYSKVVWDLVGQPWPKRRARSFKMFFSRTFRSLKHFLKQ